MYLTKLRLENYRNYPFLELTPNPGLNILVGMNAQGKTNLLEAIYYLSTGRSHRATKDLELIHWGKEHFRLSATLLHHNHSLDLDFFYGSGKKQIKVNGSKKERLIDGLFQLQIVLFYPDDLQLVKGGPAERRKYLDHEISQVSPTYFHHLTTYQKIIFQKNHFLRVFHGTKEAKSQLEIWNQQLAESGSRLLLKRLQAISKLAPLARSIHHQITGGQENLEIRYQSSLPLPKDWAVKEIEKAFMQKLHQIQSEEIRRGTSLIGPHRDDLVLLLSDKDLRTFGSQGQQRTGALSLKLAELEFIKNETGGYPVLLLDDVMSELDYDRRQFLMNFLLQRLQIFITTTNLHSFNGEILREADVYRVEEGKLHKVDFSGQDREDNENMDY